MISPTSEYITFQPLIFQSASTATLATVYIYMTY